MFKSDKQKKSLTIINMLCNAQENFVQLFNDFTAMT